MKKSVFLLMVTILAIAAPLYARGGKVSFHNENEFVSTSVDSDGNKNVCIDLGTEKACVEFDKKNRFQGVSGEVEMPISPGAAVTMNVSKSKGRVVTCGGVKAGPAGIPLGVGMEACLEQEKDHRCVRGRWKAQAGPIEGTYETDCYELGDDD